MVEVLQRRSLERLEKETISQTTFIIGRIPMVIINQVKLRRQHKSMVLIN